MYSWRLEERNRAFFESMIWIFWGSNQPIGLYCYTMYLRYNGLEMALSLDILNRLKQVSIIHVEETIAVRQ